MWRAKVPRERVYTRKDKRKSVKGKEESMVDLLIEVNEVDEEKNKVREEGVESICERLV